MFLTHKQINKVLPQFQDWLDEDLTADARADLTPWMGKRIRGHLDTLGFHITSRGVTCDLDAAQKALAFAVSIRDADDFNTDLHRLLGISSDDDIDECGGIPATVCEAVIHILTEA